MHPTSHSGCQVAASQEETGSLLLGSRLQSYPGRLHIQSLPLLWLGLWRSTRFYQTEKDVFATKSKGIACLVCVKRLSSTCFTYTDFVSQDVTLIHRQMLCSEKTAHR